MITILKNLSNTSLAEIDAQYARGDVLQVLIGAEGVWGVVLEATTTEELECE